MPLRAGSCLGPYEIVSPLGSGGMGEVYRARDAKLGRDVALKVLPEELANDPERLARFEREARMLAALNHPHIGQIHGFEQSGGASALVMELVEGEDLAQRIARGPIPVDQAVPVARQIAEALEAAHEQGIIHRDLKPANIKVRADGTVKVLDFGLAKALEAPTRAEGSSTNLANSPTITSPAAMTVGGMILGTAAYMSPEQAKGLAVDKRADIWAFGVVLYEMLVGRRLFNGDTVSETVAAVLRDDIDVTKVPTATPPAVQRLLARCLDRDPRTRLRDIGEARVLLSGPLADPPAPTAPPVTVWSRQFARGLLWLGAGIVLGAGVVALNGRRPATAEDRVPAFALRRLTELPGPELQPDIAPDGRQILYASAAAGNLDIYLLRVGGAHAINLTVNSPADDSAARFSPEGDQIVFRSERDSGGLFLMGATGESVRRLTKTGFDPAWSPDGRSVAYSMEAVDDPYNRRLQVPLWVVDIASGKTDRLVAADAVQPAWSPNGKRIAYWANTTGGQRDIWTVAASGGAPVAVTNDAATDWSPAWSPDGHWLYFSSDRGGAMNLWRVRIDPESGTRLGNLDPVTNGVRGLGYARFASDGNSLTVMSYDRTSDLAVAAFDPAHPDRITPRVTFRHQALNGCDPSPDGSWLACGNRGAREDLVLLRADGTETRRLMDDLHKDRLPLWSPDGKSLAFISTRSGQWETWRVQVDGSDLRAMTQFAADAGTGVWAPDGRRMLVAAIHAGITWTFDASQVGTRSNATVVKGAPKGFENPIWSPSGELVAGHAVTPAGTQVVGVLTLATGAWTASTAPVASRSQPVGWLPDSRHFLIQSPDGLLLVEAATGEWRRLLPGSMRDRYRISRDGRTLVIERDVFDSDVWLMRAEPPVAAGR